MKNIFFAQVKCNAIANAISLTSILGTVNVTKVVTFLLTVSALRVTAQPHKTIELSAHLNSVDKVLPLGNLHFVDDKILDGGNYKNKSFSIGLTGKYFIADNVALYLKGVFVQRNLTDNRELFAGNHNIVYYH